MDWRNNRYFCVRLASDKDYTEQIKALKKLDIRLHPANANYYKLLPDELTRRGYHHVLVGCRSEKAPHVLYSIREIIEGRSSSCVEVKNKNKRSIFIDGKQTAADLRNQLSSYIQDMPVPLTLAVVVVGDDPASKVYVRNKERACKQVGIKSVTVRLSGDTSTTAVIDAVRSLAVDPTVTGILVQLPLPRHISERDVLDAIPPEKDVDHFGAASVGRLWCGNTKVQSLNMPCTPAGILRLLHTYKIPLAGKHAVIVGRSNIVGKPMAALLLSQDCTVTVCHSKTEDLHSITRLADILIVAVGKPRFITKAMIKPGATVIDVGINRLADGTLCGDVDFDNVKDIAHAITPVPGGVGPMTVAALLYNLIRLSEGMMSK